MDLIDLLEQLHDMVNKNISENTMEEGSNESELTDFDIFKGLIEKHLNYYEDILDEKIKCQKNLQILKKFVSTKNKDNAAKIIRKLSLNDKRTLFNMLKEFDDKFTLENFNKQYEQLNGVTDLSSIDSLKKEQVYCTQFFVKLVTVLVFLYESQEEKLQECRDVLDENFKNIYKLKKFYNKMEPLGNCFINETLENILCKEMPLTDEGQEVFKRVITENNEKYQQNLEEKRKEEERLKEQCRIEYQQQQMKRETLLPKQVPETEEIEILELDDDFVSVDVIDPEFEHNVEVYTKLILECHDLDMIETNFPPKNIKKYHKLLTNIITNIREVLERNNLEMNNTNDEEVKKYIQEEIDLDTEKLNHLLNYYQTTERENVEEDIENEIHLIFATNNGKVLMLEDFKDHKYLDQRNCIDTLTLLYKLQLEDFGNSNEQGRKMQNNGTLDDVFELKGYQSRLYFKRLPGHCYYVMMAMIKKDDNTMFDRKQIENRATLTMNEFNKIKQALENGELPKQYFDEHKKIIEVSNEVLLPKSSRKI